MQISDHASETALQLFDQVATTHLADETAHLVVKILVAVHPRVNHPGGDKLVLCTVRHRHDRLHLGPKGRQVDLIHRGEDCRGWDDRRVGHDIEVTDPGIMQGHVIRPGMHLQVRLPAALCDEEGARDQISNELTHVFLYYPNSSNCQT